MRKLKLYSNKFTTDGAPYIDIYTVILSEMSVYVLIIYNKSVRTSSWCLFGDEKLYFDVVSIYLDKI